MANQLLIARLNLNNKKTNNRFFCFVILLSANKKSIERKIFLKNEIIKKENTWDCLRRLE